MLCQEPGRSSLRQTLASILSVRKAALFCRPHLVHRSIWIFLHACSAWCQGLAFLLNIKLQSGKQAFFIHQSILQFSESESLSWASCIVHNSALWPQKFYRLYGPESGSHDATALRVCQSASASPQWHAPFLHMTVWSCLLLSMCQASSVPVRILASCGDYKAHHVKC